MSDQSQLLYYKDDITEDMLLSQFSCESQFKSHESLPQRKKKLNNPNNVIQEENSNSYIREDQKSNQETKEVQLLKLANHLRQLLQKQQQDFYEKELEFQQKLLTVQQQHESMIQLMKTKYCIIIEELNQKIYTLTNEITYLKNQVQTLSEQPINQVTQRISQKKIEKDNNGYFTQRISYQPPKTSEFQNDEDKLLNLYKQEIDKVKQQTAEFERKFQNEKQTIKQEISALKNQKIVLQTLINGKQQTHSTEKPLNSEHKTNKSKRESTSRAYSHVSKKSFEF